MTCYLVGSTEPSRLVAETVNQMPLNSDAIYVTCDYSLSPRYITFPVLNPDSISLSLYTGRVLISIKLTVEIFYRNIADSECSFCNTLGPASSIKISYKIK